MTLHSPSDTDLTSPDNVIQARFELDRAMASSGYAQLSSWAVKWGRMALEALTDPVVDESDKEEIDDLNDELRQSEAALSELSTGVDQAVAIIEAAMEDHPPASELESALETALTILENAR